MKNRLLIVILLACLLAILDQFTKYLATNFFSEYVHQNHAIAFSLPLPKVLIIPATFLFIILLTYFGAKEFNLKKPLATSAFALILGGGLGNLIDRFTLGYVIDFISIWKWPVFNLADVFVTVGVLMILAFYGTIKREAKHEVIAEC